MAANRHASLHINQNMFICIVVSLLLPMVGRSAAGIAGYSRLSDEGRRTVEYHLRQGALRGLIVKPSRQYDLQYVEMFLGIPYAAPPIGNMRFMPPGSALPWSGVKMATRFAPVCPQSLPPIKKGNPPSLGRQNYMNRLKPFLATESEDCLYLNIYVPHRDTKTKKFPVLVFIHGDSFEWSSGNPYDGRILAAYGNIMVITLNFRLGILGFMKPSTTEHEYGNNGLLDQLAALTWIKDNIQDLNGDPTSVTLMGHGTGAACVNFLILSPISNGLFHRAILMSGSALSDWAMTKNPLQYTLQVAQSIGCNPSSKNLMSCLQNKPLSEIKKVQILAREFETPLGPTVAGNFITNEPKETMESFPNLLSRYQLLSGVTEMESYHDFGVIELDHGILENQRDDFIVKYNKIIFEGAGREALKDILKQYSPSKLDPQRWSVEANRDVILNIFSDARTLSPAINFANYQSKANRQSYFYVFGHNSVSTDYAPLNKSVHGEELPYVLGVPLGGANTHFHSEYTQKEKLLSEVMMRLWTNFVKIGTPNTQSVNKYFTLDHKHWGQYNVEWPEYDVEHQSYLKLDIPPYISSLYRSNYTNFWLETLPKKMRRFLIDPLLEYSPRPTTQKPKSTHRVPDPIQKIWKPQVAEPPRYSAPTYGRVRLYSPPETRSEPDIIYGQTQSMKPIPRTVPPNLMDKAVQPTEKPLNPNLPVKMSGATVTLIISLGILFLAVNVGICSILYFKKRKLRIREQAFEIPRQPRADVGEVDVIGQKGSKDDKSALQTFKNGCSVIKSMSFNKLRDKKKHKKKSEPCKTPKSDDSGGFRERFQLRRHLSTSTLDAHTKVRDWIANEVMHRCSPGIMRKSNSDLNNDKRLTVIKPFTRSEELLSDVKRSKKEVNNVEDMNSTNNAYRKSGNKTRTSEKTTSTSALDSHSSIGSNKNSTLSIKQTRKSSDSLRSKGTESIKSKKVSVAIDATPAARTNSILKQEPIEIYKSFDCGETRHSNNENILEKSRTEDDINLNIVQNNPVDEINETKTYTNVVMLSVDQEKPLRISHKHSSSDPVTDVNYDKLMKDKRECGNQIINILPPVTFRNDINVTSYDERTKVEPLTAEEALLTIKRRNFPKVLPDLPKTQKRLSLQPTSLQTFRNYIENSYNQCDRPKVPPQPPPRTTTLDRRLAYRNTKPLNSFDSFKSSKISETYNSDNNYENIDSLTPHYDSSQTNIRLPDSITQKSPTGSVITTPIERDYPKVIIASSNIPLLQDPRIIIKAPSSQIELPSNIPRIRLPDDFHSQAGSITSFSSFCSDDEENIDDEEEEDFLDDLTEDKLIKELVGGIESPTNMSETLLDTKGPDTIFEKKLEIVPVKINMREVAPKSNEDYIYISDLHLPGISELDKTAQIKPNFSLNKLQHRTESIHRPPEKAVKLKPKRSIKPASILSKSIKGKKGSNKSKSSSSTLEYSNSGSSNDTETSTGTVKKIEIKKDLKP